MSFERKPVVSIELAIAAIRGAWLACRSKTAPLPAALHSMDETPAATFLSVGFIGAAAFNLSTLTCASSQKRFDVDQRDASSRPSGIRSEVGGTRSVSAGGRVDHGGRSRREGRAKSMRE
jgi:hypothetical protein